MGKKSRLRKSLFIITTLVMLLSTLLVGCGKGSSSGNTNSSTKNNNLDVLKIAEDDWVYVAQKKGWLDNAFKKYGVKKVQIVQGTLGNEVQLFSRNELHIADRMIYPVLLYKSQGADIKVVSVSQHPATNIASIIVPKNSSIKTFEDLKGKKIASWRAGCPYMVLFEKAEKLNWKEGKDWKYVNIPSSENKTALLSGEVDAISAHPFRDVAAILLDGSGREIANPDKDSVYINGGGVTVNFTSSKFAKDHPDIVKKYLDLQQSTEKWMLENKDEAAKIVQGVTRTPVALSKFQWERESSAWVRTSNNISQIKSETGKLQDWLIKHNDLQESKKVDLNGLFDDQYFNK